MSRYSATLSIPTLATLAFLACACGDPSPSVSAPAADAGADTTVTEDVIVIAQSDEDALPLEGATVALEQDGVISVQEVDGEGRATFVFDPQGSSVTVSASYPRHRAHTRVAVTINELLEAMNSREGLVMSLLVSRPPMITLSGSIGRRDPSATLGVETDTEGVGGLPAGWNSDEFSTTARANKPFVISVYEQLANEPVSPFVGASWPISSWQTYSHGGSSRSMNVLREAFRSHELSQHSFAIPRPTRPASMASDDATPFVSAYMWSTRYPYKELAAAETSSVEAWAGQDRYEVSVTGRADLMDSPSLSIRAVIYDAQGRYTTIESRGKGISASLEGPFLPPPEVATRRPTTNQPLTWEAPSGDTVWTYLSASDDNGARWIVSAPPGVVSLDVPALLATLPASGLGERDLQASLTFCEHDVERGCRRNSGTVPFTLTAE